MCQTGIVERQLACEQCGKVFAPHKNAFRKQRFCSKPCADKAAHRSAASRRTAVCQVCEKRFNPKMGDRTTCCSRECGWEYHRRNRFAAMNQAATERREAERLRLLFERLKQCAVCKSAFVANRQLQVACSGKCQREYQRRKAIVAAGYDPDSKPCKACGKEVEGTGTVRAFRPSLCRACAKQASRLSKRRAKRKRGLKQSFATAKHKSAKVMAGLNVLLKFAGNQCPCCGLLMSKAVHPNHDRALELDHALPLSRGGNDLFPNLRPMCRKCNGLKGATTAPDIVIGEWLRESTNQSTHQASVHTHYSDREGFPKGVLNNV